MSDFAFNRAIEKQRKMIKNHASTVVASVLQTQALNYYSGRKSTQINNLLTEAVTSFRKEIIASKMPGYDSDLSFETICLSCAMSSAVLEKDIEDFTLDTITGSNQVKILVNLKLLPESFLSIEFDEESVS